MTTAKSTTRRSTSESRARSSTPARRSSGGTSTKETRGTAAKATKAPKAPKATKETQSGDTGRSRAANRAASSRTVTLSVPTVSMQARRVKVPDVRLPEVRMPDLGPAVERVRSQMPPPSELAYFAGLGLLGVLEVIEWPIVLVVGAGTVVAQRAAQAVQRSRGTEAAASGSRR